MATFDSVERFVPPRQLDDQQDPDEEDRANEEWHPVLGDEELNVEEEIDKVMNRTKETKHPECGERDLEKFERILRDNSDVLRESKMGFPACSDFHLSPITCPI